MTKEIKVLLGIGLATVALLVGAVFLLSKSPATGSSASGTVPAADVKVLVRDDNFKIASDSAKVTIVEFADFQCPACAAAHPTVNKVLEDYGGKVNFIYRHFPLPQHKNAQKAAEAAEAAGEQGKFWEMYNKLYDNQNQWSEGDNAADIFVGYARDLNLDSDNVKQEIEAEKFKAKINRDYQDGVTLGVNSTPTFFIDGQKTPGALSYDDFKNRIDSELSK